MSVAVYPGRGLALVLSKGADSTSYLLDVLDMQSVTSQKSHDIDLAPRGYHTRGSLHIRADEPIVVFSTLDAKDKLEYLGLNLITGAFSSDFQWADGAEAYSAGTGSSFVDRHRPFAAVMHGNQVVSYGGASPRRDDMSWRLPERWGWEPGATITRVLVNNDDVRMISVYPRIELSSETRGLGLHVFDKSKGEWAKLDVPTGLGSFRAFGYWIAREEIQPYRPGTIDLEPYRRHWTAPFLSTAERFEFRRYSPSGRLFFYNARTRTITVHDTGEPDSEVLHVDGADVAWYRVSDELRKAKIENGKLKDEEVVVKAPEMWAVHWLFFGKE